jgi:hypothetical protein
VAIGEQGCLSDKEYEARKIIEITFGRLTAWIRPTGRESVESWNIYHKECGLNLKRHNPAMRLKT